MVLLVTLPLLLIAPLIEAWAQHRDRRRRAQDELRACRLLYGPTPGERHPHD